MQLLHLSTRKVWGTPKDHHHSLPRHQCMLEAERGGGCLYVHSDSSLDSQETEYQLLKVSEAFWDRDGLRELLGVELRLM